jgi:hypothetical protein
MQVICIVKIKTSFRGSWRIVTDDKQRTLAVSMGDLTILTLDLNPDIVFRWYADDASAAIKERKTLAVADKFLSDSTQNGTCVESNELFSKLGLWILEPGRLTVLGIGKMGLLMEVIHSKRQVATHGAKNHLL